MIAMLRRRHVSDGLQEARVVRDLGIVVTEVELGTIVSSTEPNYALLSNATRTIKKFLERIHNRDVQAVPAARDSMMPEPLAPPGELDFHAQLEPWGFEIDFWNHLAEHPSMISPDTTQQYW